MPETLFTVQSDEPGWRPESAPDEWELTRMVVDAIDEALGHDPLEQRPVGGGPASITTGPPWGFESPVDCEQETIDLLTALKNTDEPLDALVTGQLHRGVAPEEVTFTVIGIKVPPD